MVRPPYPLPPPPSTPTPDPTPPRGKSRIEDARILMIIGGNRDAWHSHANLSRTDAKRLYIATLIETMHRYATTTPEARELVAELEFVWDQIKSRSASSSLGSSPRHDGGREGEAGGGEGFGKGGDGDGDGGLRVLRPFSEGEGGEEEGEEEGDWDVRNRKWRRRVEGALGRIGVEVAAVRELVEGARVGDLRRREGVGGWFWWVLRAAVRHAVFDAVVVAFLVLLARWRGDGRAEVVLRGVGEWVGERVERVRKLKFGKWEGG